MVKMTDADLVALGAPRTDGVTSDCFVAPPEGSTSGVEIEVLSGELTGYAMIRIPVGGQLAGHVHVGQFEHGYVLAGSIEIAQQGTLYSEINYYGRWDVYTVEPGDTHAIRNCGDEPAKILASLELEADQNTDAA